MLLFDHQKNAIDACLNSDAMLVYRLPGTGKTLIGVEIIRKILENNGDNLVLWLSPANIIEQSRQVFNSAGLESYKFDTKIKAIRSGICVFVSYETLRSHVDILEHYVWDCVVCDEFHHAKNSATHTNKAIKRIRKKSKKFYAFTGTPFQNTPYEFFELLNVVANKKLSYKCERTLKFLRPKRSFFREMLSQLGIKVNRLNQGPVIGVEEPDKLCQLVSSYINYELPEVYIKECHIPTVMESFEFISLTESEIISYNEVLKSYKKKKEKRFFYDILPDENIESSFNNLSLLRQNLLCMDGKKSSKIIHCVTDIKKVLEENDSRILVFSNFVKYGVCQCASMLKKENIPFSLYDGSTSQKSRNIMLSSYRNGKVPVVLLSPVGFEGLDLYGTTHIFVLDPHFNPEKTRQLISRAIRAYSSVEHITIKHYIAVTNNPKQLCIDEAILKISYRKKMVAEMIEKCLGAC